MSAPMAITQDDLGQLLRAYADGVPLNMLAREHGVSKNVDRRWLTRAGVEIRPSYSPPSAAFLSAIVAEYQRGASLKSLTARHHIAKPVIMRALDAAGVEVRRRLWPEPDASGFREPRSYWHAYWIGFLLAHGSFSRAPSVRHQFRVTIRAADVDHLENLRSGLGMQIAIRSDVRGGVHSAWLQQSSVTLSTVLAAWGIVPGKAASHRFPWHMPARWHSACLHGYLDARMSVTPRRSCFVASGSIDMLEDVAALLAEPAT